MKLTAKPQIVDCPAAWRFEFNNGTSTIIDHLPTADIIRKHLEEDEKAIPLYAAEETRKVEQ